MISRFTHIMVCSIKKNFSLDLRSLALFRVVVSIILIIDFLFTRLPYFTLFYTNKGLLPLKQLFLYDSFWAGTSSLNFISSDSVFQLALLVISIIFFFMLLIGYKTKWVLLGTWILLVSFQSRNFLILNSGDTLLCLLIFWSLRLPLGKYFSIDSAFQEHKEKTNWFFSIPSSAFIFQILMVYYFTYLLKTDDIWKTGQAVYYALMLDNFRTQWGDILLQYPRVMNMLSHFTYYVVENLVPFLFVFFGIWWRFKMMLILVMCFFHLSLGTFLHLGLFSWVCLAGWIAFIPGEFWDRIKEHLPQKNHKLFVYYDGDCSFCKKMVLLIKTFLILPHVSFSMAQSDPQALSEMEKQNSWLVFDGKTWWGRWKAWAVLVSYSPLFFYLSPVLKIKKMSLLGDWFYGKVAMNRKKLGYLLPHPGKEKECSKVVSILLSCFFFFCFIYVIMWNVRTLNFNYYSKYMPKEWNRFGAFFHLHQHWNMFSPKPFDTTGWIILSAIKSDTGDKIDLWRQGKPLRMNKPIRYDTSFPVFRFRKMIENVTTKYKKHSGNYLSYLCNKWNKKKGGRYIENIEFIYMRQKIPPPGGILPIPEFVSIRRKSCPKR
ncbi:MAG: DCC1-like thiol-disulfide oxidoreductase family protein [Bdellovibrionales bacterium]|nr:DCC1-like thiol-disulfide oxidoreductase family protein [Bdellovibrionales bacterium]